jgi:hypothetical protein
MKKKKRMKDFILQNKFWFIGLGGVGLLAALAYKKNTPTPTPTPSGGLPYLNLIPTSERSNFEAKVKSFCNSIGARPEWLMCVMHFESAGSMSPKKYNSIGCVGLIQFCPGNAGAAAVGKTPAQLAAMSHTQQLDYVFLYFKKTMQNRGISRVNSFIELYMIVFYPAYTLKGLDEKLPTSIYSYNPAYVRGGVMSKRTILQTFVNKYGRYVQ